MTSVFASPGSAPPFESCYFYHTTDVPGHGVVEGEWDLRAGVAAYLGGVDFRGMRVLEMGTADGCLCFHMERAGADVVAFDLSPKENWDGVPYAGTDAASFAAVRRGHIERLNNAFWYCHRAFQSKARAVYGTAYAVPDEVGSVDIATFGSILLHLQDPFLALESALRLTRKTVIVTDAVPRGYRRLARLQRMLAWTPIPYLRKAGRRLCAATTEFMPDAARQEPRDTWWNLSPEAVIRMMAVLGFEETRLTFHTQPYKGKNVDLFTVVGQRTRS
jgi:hypothetical protein